MGLLWGSSAEKWDASRMPAQTGKVGIVTGANSGIDYYTARALAENGAFVVLACRNEKRGQQAELEIQEYLRNKKSSGNVEYIPIDLANLKSVREFVRMFKSRYSHLDVLINNAGIAAPIEVMTVDGFETQFQVNHLSHFLLTALLFPLLRASPAARLVTVSSLAHRTASIDFPMLVKGTEYSLARYGRSKLTNALFTLELAKRLEDSNISNVKALIAHPGMTYSAMANKIIESYFPHFAWTPLEYLATWVPFQDTEMGALPTLYATTAEDAMNGDHVGPADYGHRRGYPAKQTPGSNTQKEDDRVELWRLSEALADVHFDVA